MIILVVVFIQVKGYVANQIERSTDRERFEYTLHDMEGKVIIVDMDKIKKEKEE